MNEGATAEPQWFAGRRALVTGAARRIGLGIAILLDAMGARVIACDCDAAALDRAPLPETVERLLADVGADPNGLADAALREGPVELLVNNAASTADRRFLALEDAERDRALAVNLTGPWTLSRRLAQALIDAERSGAFVFISSLHDHRVRLQPDYSASKAALRMLTAEMAYELAPHRIRVNSVSPGGVPADGESLDADVHKYPLGRKQTAQDIARMTAVLLSETWSGQVTGANVPVDGGLDLFSWWTFRPSSK